MKFGKSTLKIIGYVIFFAIFSTATAQADEVSITVSPESPFTDVAVNSGGSAYQIDVAANGGDPVVQLYSDDAPSEFNSIADDNPANHIAEDDDGGPGLSSLLSGSLGSGNYTIRVTSFSYWVDGASPTSTYTLTYTGLNSGGRTVGSSLRLDTAGTIIEKSNIVSCAPGTYSFINSGSTAEAAKIQSYVYTLLVNGKVVSTLSTDGFKSVPSHLFPTIAGNMAGTATLTGASWDLTRMSNYSASCQIYATQSNGNNHSLTNTVLDSVALSEQRKATQAWEDQRAAATAANFTKEAREMRKRLAARSNP